MSRAELVKAAAMIAMAGLLAVVAADVVSWFLAESYSPISQTISALAVGSASWLIDLGLWTFCISCIGIGSAMASLNSSPGDRRLVSLATIALGIDVAIISFLNEYAGKENTGADFHTWAVYALYVLFAVAAFSASSALRPFSQGAAVISLVCGLAWAILGPVYYFWYPEGWVGAFERVLAILMLVALATIARALLRNAADSRVTSFGA